MVRVTCLTMVRKVYTKSSSNVNSNGDKLNTIPLKSVISKSVHFPYLFSIILSNLSRAKRKPMEINGIQIQKEVVRASLLEDGMIINIRDSKNSKRQHLCLITTLLLETNPYF